MKKELETIADYCKKNKVELCVDAEDIHLYFTIASSDFVLKPVKPEKVEEAVSVILAFRKQGFKSN